MDWAWSLRAMTQILNLSDPPPGSETLKLWSSRKGTIPNAHLIWKTVEKSDLPRWKETGWKRRTDKWVYPRKQNSMLPTCNTRNRRRKWQPTLVFLPGKSHGQRSLQATVHGVTRVGQDLATKPPAYVTQKVTTLPGEKVLFPATGLCSMLCTREPNVHHAFPKEIFIVLILFFLHEIRGCWK